MIRHSAPSLGAGEAEAAARVVRSGHLAQGPEVEAFESECAAVVGRRYAVAMSSGTAALHLALEALDLPAGAEALAPSYACASLVTAIDLAGARPRLVDVDDAGNFAAPRLDGAATAIVPHLFGAPARLPEGGPVIEDIAQSIGGPTGRAGVMTVASFYATKLMTTGEGGMVLTDDERLAGILRDRRDYDNRDDFRRRYNYKMTDLQAAIGRVQLRRLRSFIERRRAIAGRYDEGLAGLPLRLPGGAGHVYFRYVVATPLRDALEAHLAAGGIEAKRPVYRPGHHYLGGDHPLSERAHREFLSIPVHPELLESDVDLVIHSLHRFFEKA